uniref:Uncharacterized protein n=1 Tax=Latimeria chalumnae TaxID=7897 RepID=H3A5R6_LATCH
MMLFCIEVSPLPRYLSDLLMEKSTFRSVAQTPCLFRKFQRLNLGVENRA